MNTENQTLIIKFFGILCILLILGVILLTAALGYNPELITSLTGLIMVFATALATFLSTKTMTEKQETTLEQYWKNKAQHENELENGEYPAEKTTEEQKEKL